MARDQEDDDRFERLRRQNSSDGYTGTGFGLNDNELFGGFRLPSGASDHSPRWSKFVAIALLVIAGFVAIAILL